MSTLSNEELDRELAALPGWERAGNAIQRKFTFPAYLDGAAFAGRVANAAEAANHHPDILIGYREVTVTFTSHDSGGVTDRDVKMARAVQELAAS